MGGRPLWQCEPVRMVPENTGDDVVKLGRNSSILLAPPDSGLLAALWARPAPGRAPKTTFIAMI